tara:strand:+ start:654 stop:854 length:201 start_codon:yes stop_codon:yes gene_type:complete
MPVVSTKAIPVSVSITYVRAETEIFLDHNSLNQRVLESINMVDVISFSVSSDSVINGSVLDLRLIN